MSLAHSPPPGSVHQLFEEQALACPESVALSYGAKLVTYRQLNARANRLARHLQAAGAGAESLVGICLERSPDAIVTMVAVLKAGAAYVPMDTAYPPDRLSVIAADQPMAAIVCRERTRDRLRPACAAVISLERDADVISSCADGDLGSGAAGARLACVIYTSGSTGRPKGVGVTHEGIIALLVDADYARLGRDSRIAQVSSISFDVSTFEIWGALLHGGTVVGVTREQLLSARALRQRIETARVTDMVLSSSLFAQLVREDPALFASLDTLLVGGEPVDPGAAAAVRRAGPPRQFAVSYGPTEATTFASTWPVTDQAEPPGADVAGLPIGQPIANTVLRILDDRGDPVPDGAKGELCIGGPRVARGYLGGRGLTADRFIPDAAGESSARLYRTGDMVRRRADGALDFLGRRDSQVKLRGYRIELGEIECALRDCPGVADAAALATGPPGEPEKSRIVACAVRAGAGRGDLSERQLLRRLGDRLPEFMVPSAVLITGSMPVNENGKLDREAIKTWLAELAMDTRASSSAGPSRTSDSEHELMRGVWGRVLGSADIGADDDFFDIGGNSLLAMRLMAEVAATFGCQLAVIELYRHPSVRELSAVVRAHAGEGSPAGPDQSIRPNGGSPDGVTGGSGPADPGGPELQTAARGSAGRPAANSEDT